MIKHIIVHDWRLIRSTPLSKIVLLLLVIISALSIWNGNAIYNRRLSTQKDIVDYEKMQFRKLEKNIQAIEAAGGLYTGSPHQDPRVASNVAYRYGARYLLYSFHPLSKWVIGQSDVYPHYYRVTATKKNGMILNEEIENPQILFNGSFDFAFVIIYILPLLIIAFTYNLAASEREWGTLRLLLSGSVQFREFQLIKFGFRFLLFSAVFLLMLVLSALFSKIPLGNAFFIFALSGVAWTALWFTISLFMNSIVNKSSGSTAAALVSTWLLFVLLLPGIFSYVINTTWPVPSRIDLITKTREAAEETKKRTSQVLARYLEDHPELVKDSAGIDPADFYIRFYTGIKETEKVIEPLEKEFITQLQKQNEWIRKFRYFSPAIVMQDNLNGLAATDEVSYRLFQDQVHDFYKQLQAYYIKRVVGKQNFRPADLSTIPAPAIRNASMGEVTGLVIYLMLLPLIFLVLSIYTLNKFRPLMI